MKKTLIAIGLGALTAGVMLASIKTDYSHSANFGQYHTYSWIKAQAGDQLWADRIKRDVDAQLQAKGWTEVPSGGEAAVSAFGSTHNQQSLETYYNGFGGGWFWRGFGDDMATTQVVNTPVGTLVVDIFDGNTHKLIWRATSSNTITGNPEKNEKKLEKDVEDMFKKFPPQEKHVG